MEIQDWMKELVNNLRDKLIKIGLNFELKEKIDNTNASLEFIQGNRTAAFFCLMNTDNIKIDVFFLPMTDYEAICDMQTMKMYTPKIAVIKGKEEFMVLLIKETGSNDRTSDEFTFKTVRDIAEFIFEYLQKHIKGIRF